MDAMAIRVQVGQLAALVFPGGSADAEPGAAVPGSVGGETGPGSTGGYEDMGDPAAGGASDSGVSGRVDVDAGATISAALYVSGETVRGVRSLAARVRDTWLEVPFPGSFHDINGI